jgi:hypothetical protein
VTVPKYAALGQCRCEIIPAVGQEVHKRVGASAPKELVVQRSTKEDTQKNSWFCDQLHPANRTRRNYFNEDPPYD